MSVDFSALSTLLSVMNSSYLVVVFVGVSLVKRATMYPDPFNDLTEKTIAGFEITEYPFYEEQLP
jgi:hypothetical protein